MNDVISRQAALDAIYERIKQIGYENNPDVLSIRQAVREVPPATPEKNIKKHQTDFSDLEGESDVPDTNVGEWIIYYHGVDENKKSIFSYTCNQCYHDAPYELCSNEYSQKKWDFCPTCGVKMEERKKQC